MTLLLLLKSSSLDRDLTAAFIFDALSLTATVKKGHLLSIDASLGALASVFTLTNVPPPRTLAIAATLGTLSSVAIVIGADRVVEVAATLGTLQTVIIVSGPQRTYPSEPEIALTAAQILALITADRLHVDFGAHLLDANDVVSEDISADLLGGEVEHNNYADVHGTCVLRLTRPLDWTNARVRPYQTLMGAGLTKTWPLGVFLLTTPEMPLGETPVTYDVGGYDKLHLLQKPVGDTYVVEAGTGYLEAVLQAITDSGATGGAPLLDGTAQDKTLPTPMVWVLDPSRPTRYIDIVNDLLAAVSYRGLWADANGRFRSEPYQSPVVRPPAWTLDLSDPRTQIVSQNRRFTTDAWRPTNWWRFIQRGLPTQPIEDAGLYTVDLSGGGAKYKSVHALDVANQESLEAAGDAIVQTALQLSNTLVIETGPLPLLGHFDVLAYRDPAFTGEMRLQTRSYRIPLRGDQDVTLTLEVVNG